jgi:shikimate kinase
LSRTIIIIGPRGVGKTTAAQKVAAALGRAAVDLDVEIVREAGRSIAEIWRSEGEAGFRDREARALAAALARTDGPVIAPGGGVVLRPENRDAIARSAAHVVHLSARAETLAARIEKDPATARDRPALAPGGALAEARTLLAARGPYYRALAKVEVGTDDLSVDEVAARVVATIDPK